MAAAAVFLLANPMKEPEALTENREEQESGQEENGENQSGREDGQEEGDNQATGKAGNNLTVMSIRMNQSRRKRAVIRRNQRRSRERQCAA